MTLNWGTQILGLGAMLGTCLAGTMGVLSEKFFKQPEHNDGLDWRRDENSTRGPYVWGHQPRSRTFHTIVWIDPNDEKTLDALRRTAERWKANRTDLATNSSRLGGNALDQYMFILRDINLTRATVCIPLIFRTSCRDD